MSEQAWTKEPWLVNEHGSVLAADANDVGIGQTVVRIVGFVSPIGTVADSDAGNANRDRAVDCVNAMLGIPNPAEFVRAARELASQVADDIENLKAEDGIELISLADALSAFRAAVEAVEGEKGAKQQ